MLHNIKTGYGGVPRLPNEDIVLLVSSLHRVVEIGLRFVFTNQHAYPLAAEYFNDLADLGRVDWPLLQRRDFRNDPDDPGKKERYQAEALIHQHLPVAGLLGIACSSQCAEAGLRQELQRRNLALKLVVRPGWYF